jgi:hypothetical protein
VAYHTLKNRPIGEIKAALNEARGDVFIAAQALGVRVSDLDHAIITNDELKIAMGVIAEVKLKHQDDEASQHLAASERWFDQEVSRRANMYRLTALEEIVALATMDVDTENAALMQVKLNAAIKLRGEEYALGSHSEIEGFFKMLDSKYRELAPRVKTIRASLIELQVADQPPPLT